jgi:dihydrofolate reductase
MKASVFIGTSLDGFIARPDGSFGFLPDEPEEHGYTEFVKTVQAHLIGRKTYETVLGFGGWAYGKKPVFVLSSKPLAPAPPEAVLEHLQGDPKDVAAQLDARGIERVYLDGGETIQRFLEAGLVDRMIITRVPVVIGSGIPLFGPVTRDIRLRHIRTQSYPSGLVSSEYEVAG